MIEEKPKFVFTGEKEEVKVNWRKIDSTFLPERRGTSFHFIVVSKNGRADVYTTDMTYLEDFATREIVPHGRGKYVSDDAQVYWVSKEGKEFLLGTVTKKLTRYYEPVSRFDHSKD